MIDDEIGKIIASIRAEIESAADVILSSVEEGLGQIAEARDGDVGALERIQQNLFVMLEACAFQDLTGQRLTRLHELLSAQPLDPVDANPLLNGPALAGQGLDQRSADRLMESLGAWDPGSEP